MVGLFPIADLAITKTDSPDPVTAGTNLTYTITVTNNGPDVATSASWDDTLPAGTTFASLPLVAGWSCTTGATVNCSNPSFGVGSAVFTLTVAVAPSVAAGSILSNTATVTSASADGTAGNNSATALTTVSASADLSVTKVDFPDPVIAGGTITYTITVTNAGPSDAQTVTLADTLPAGTTFAALVSPAGWSCTTPAVGSGGAVNCSNPLVAVGSEIFTLDVTVDPVAAEGSIISNTATTASATPDPAPGDTSATSTTTVAPASARLSLIKNDDIDPVLPGGLLTYTITLTNEGPSSAVAVAMSDPLPAGTTFQSLSAPVGWSCTTPAVGAGGTVSCSLALMAPGSVFFSIVVETGAALPSGTMLSNTATASSTTSDPSPGNESDTEVTTIGETSGDVSVTIDDLPDPVDGGSSVTYTVVAALSATVIDATDITLSMPLDSDAGFQSLAAPAGWSCATPPVGSAGTVICSIASLPASASESFDLVVLAPNDLPPGAVIVQDVSFHVTADGREVVAVDSEETTVLAPANLTATKSVVTTGNPGTAVTYTVVLENFGPATQADNAGDEFTDTLPVELDLNGATADSGTATADIFNGVVTWNGSIPPGGSVTIVIEATLQIGTAAGTTITNQGAIAFDADGDGTNESTGVTDDPAAAGADDPTTFTVVEIVPVIEIPSLDEVGLFSLALLLAGLAMLRLRRSRGVRG